MNKVLKLLIIEDSEDDAELVLRELRRAGYEPECERVDTPWAMRAALDRQAWDAIVADYAMPQFSGPAALALMKERDLDLPFIVVSGKIGEDAAVAAMKAGAHDFVLKGNLARLVPAIERELREAEVRLAHKAAEETLRESEERFRRLFEEAPIAYHEIDRQGVVRRVNSAECALLGLERGEILGRHAWEFVAPEYRDACSESALKRISGEAKLVPYEQEYVTRNGGRLIVEIRENLIRDMHDNVIGMRCALTDITARKWVEELIQRQVHRLSALRDVEKAIIASLDLRAILSVVVDQVTTQLGVDCASILLLDASRQVLEFAAGRGFHLHGARPPVRLGQGPAGRAALARRSFFVANVAEAEPNFAEELLPGEKFVFYYAAPLVARGELKGVLEILHRAPLAPDHEWLDFVEALSAEAAIAIDNAKLVEDLQRTNAELTRAYDASLEGWVRALDLRHKEREGHTERVTEMTVRLARAMGIFGAELENIRRGALLHDIGKIGIPDSILHKTNPLSEQERDILRRHPSYAYELLSPIKYLHPALDIPHCHHEKWDGSGYPRGLRGEQIPLPARIFSVVEVWDALLSPRPSGAGWPADKVYDYLRRQAGSHFDPTVVDVFLRMIMQPPPDWIPCRPSRVETDWRTAHTGQAETACPVSVGAR